MTQDTPHPMIRLILHAPSPASLERARNNAVNLRRADPEADVRIIVNAEAVAAALDVTHPEADACTWLCPNTLARINRKQRQPLQMLGGSAVLEIALMQGDGWAYIRS